MGIAQNFNKAIRQQLTSYAAWWPIVNTFKVGEYGDFKDGIFHSQGNLKDKYPGIKLKIEEGGPAEIEFSSDGMVTTKIDADGNTTDTFAGLGNVEATMKIVFEKENSSMFKAKCTSEELKNIDEVATFLANKRDWRNKFCVVSKIYKGEKCVVICTREAGTEINIKAKADVLQQIEAGKVSGGYEFKSSKDSTFKAIGETGVIALGLFKLNIFNNTKILNLESEKDFKIESLKGEVEDAY